MANTSDPATLEDDRRHREILRRTRMGLQEDLDDLRDELVDHLEDFELRLQRTARHLPRWLDLPENSLRKSFELPTPESLKGVLIGPRTVAMTAAKVEQFLGNWLGDDDFIQAWSIRDDDDSIAQLQEELTQLESSIKDAYEAVCALADDGPFELEQILESIVFELETRRETDVEALESMIQQGDVDAGRDAQSEIAELWEEQRRRAGQLQRVWDDILALHHEGITRTLSGLEELKELAQRARDGIEGAGVFKLPEEDEAQKETAPPPSPLPEIEPDHSGLASGSSSNRFLRAPSEAELDVAKPDPEPDAQLSLIDEPGPTEPMIGDPTVDLKPAPIVEEQQTSHSNEEVFEEKAIDTTIVEEQKEEEKELVEEEISETTPMIEDAKQHLIFKTQQPEKTEEIQDIEQIEESEHVEESEQAEPIQQTQEIQEVNYEEEPAADDREQAARDRVRLRSFRIRTGWQIVTAGEATVALTAPVLLLLFFVIASLLSFIDMAPNPMVHWDWAFRLSLGVMSLLVIIPLSLGWRPMWRGRRFTILRRGEVEDEIDLRLTENRLHFDRTSWPLKEIRSLKLAKWESESDETQGWLLTIDPPYQTPFDLATFEASNSAWEKSSAPLIDPPSDAWQIPPEEFEVIHDTIRQALDDPRSR